MSAADIGEGTTRRPFSGRRVRFGDVTLQVGRGRGRARRRRARRPDRSGRWSTAPGSRSQERLGFVTRVAWNPVVGRELYGAGSFLFGTVVTSFGALLLATPLAIGVALFLTELAPRAIQGPVTALVETLAAVPSVVDRPVGASSCSVPLLRTHDRALAARRDSGSSRSSGIHPRLVQASSRRSSS